MDDDEREAARMRLEIPRGIQQAFSSWPAVRSVIWEAADRQAAVQALQGDVGLSEAVAQYVLDLPQGRTTIQARRDLAEQADERARILRDD